MKLQALLSEFQDYMYHREGLENKGGLKFIEKHRNMTKEWKSTP